MCLLLPRLVGSFSLRATLAAATAAQDRCKDRLPQDSRQETFDTWVVLEIRVLYRSVLIRVP